MVDLMEALRKSLKGGGGPSRDKADRFLEAHGRKAKPKARKKASAAQARRLSAGTPRARLDRTAIHIAVDMQCLFAEPTEWFVPWLPKVLPKVREIAGRHPDRTMFTRFIPPHEPEQAAAPGATITPLAIDDARSHRPASARAGRAAAQAGAAGEGLEQDGLFGLCPSAAGIRPAPPRHRNPDRHRRRDRCLRHGHGYRGGRSRFSRACCPTDALCSSHDRPTTL